MEASPAVRWTKNCSGLQPVGGDAELVKLALAQVDWPREDLEPMLSFAVVLWVLMLRKMPWKRGRCLTRGPQDESPTRAQAAADWLPRRALLVNSIGLGVLDLASVFHVRIVLHLRGLCVVNLLRLLLFRSRRKRYRRETECQSERQNFHASILLHIRRNLLIKLKKAEKRQKHADCGRRAPESFPGRILNQKGCTCKIRHAETSGESSNMGRIADARQ